MKTLKRKTLIRFIIVIVILCLLFCFTYFIVNTRYSQIDLTNIPVLQNSESSYIYVEKSEKQDNILCIEVFSKNATISKEYHNWVSGDGANTYVKCSVVLVDESGINGYKLKTYSSTVVSSDDETVKAVTGDQDYSNNGFVARIPYNKLSGEKLKIAMLYEDLEGNEMLIYPVEDYYVE